MRAFILLVDVVFDGPASSHLRLRLNYAKQKLTVQPVQPLDTLNNFE